MPGLRETLEAATRVGEWHVDQDEPWRVRAEDGYPVAFCGTLPGHPDPSPWRAEWSAHLIALAPELASLVLDMGDLLREAAYAPVTWSEPGTDGPERADALLARLDQLGKEQT